MSYPKCNQFHSTILKKIIYKNKNKLNEETKFCFSVGNLYLLALFHLKSNVSHIRVEGFVFVIIICCCFWVSSVYLSEKLLRIKFFRTLWVMFCLVSTSTCISNQIEVYFLFLRILFQLRRKGNINAMLVVWVVCKQI